MTELEKVAVGPVYKRVFDHGSSQVGEFYERQVAKLCLNIFYEGLLACLKEFNTLVKHLSWTSTALKVELPDLPKVYSPLILQGFHEELMN